MYSFCGELFEMSFWIVPDSTPQSTPGARRGRIHREHHRRGRLIVIDVVTLSRRMPSNSASSRPAMPHWLQPFPTSPRASGWSGSRPIKEGRSNATLSPVAPAPALPVALVRALRRAEPGKLPHRPQLACIPVGVDAPRVRIDPASPRSRA